jgi:hypothetical protein
MQVGLGDPEVPNLASLIHARALGLKQLGAFFGARTTSWCSSATGRVTPTDVVRGQARARARGAR